MADSKVQAASEVALAALKRHPRNYRTHPEAQILHLMHSIEEPGFYRNIVLARDDTILAGHGIAEASRRLGLEKVPAVRLDLDPNHPLALKLLAADNYLPYFAEDDDRVLTDLLKELADTDYSLPGTGFDEQQLALLAMVTRPASEIADFDAAAEWVGMPDYAPSEKRIQLVLTFLTENDRQKLVDEPGVIIRLKNPYLWSAMWPPAPVDDASSVFFDG